MEITITHKSKNHQLTIPEEWAECSKKEVSILVDLLVFQNSRWVVAVDKYLRKVHNLPRKAVKNFYRHDLITSALSFVSEEQIYSTQILPPSIGLIKGPGENLSYMIIRDYFLAGALMRGVDLEADRKTLRKKLRLLASVVYKNRYHLQTQNKLWFFLARFYSSKKLEKMYYTLAGALRCISDQYPEAHAKTSTDDNTSGIAAVQNSLNSLSGGKFGTRREVETYRIHEVLPEIEALAIQRLTLAEKPTS